MPLDCTRCLYLYLGLTKVNGRPVDQLGIVQEFREGTYVEWSRTVYI